MRLLERLLLAAWPPDERDRQRGELTAFWRAQRREARYNGPLGGLRFVRHVGLDAIVTGLRLRWGQAKGRKGMGGSLTTDLGYALRALLRARHFTALAVGTLALGIGALTAVFAVVDGVVLRPLPYPEPDRLVVVHATLDEDQPNEASWPDFRDWREQAAGFAGMVGHVEASESFEWDGGAETLRGAMVTHDFFDVMGVPLQLGRSFTPEEDRTGGGAVIVLSHELWQRRFDGAPDVLGRSVPLSSGAATVVGVAAPGFDAPRAGTEYWLPLQEDALLARVGLPTGTRTLSFIHVLGRLDAGAALGATEEGLRELAQRIDDEVGKREDQRSAVVLVPLMDEVVGDARTTLLFLLGAAGLVLLVAATNTMGLAVSRAAARGPEIAVRSALGAGRRRIGRQLYAEGLLLAGAAGVAGVGLATIGLEGLVRLAPPGLPRIDAVGITPGTVVAAAIASAATGLVFGFVSASRPGAGGLEALRSGQRAGTTRSGLLTQQLLVTVQVAVAVVLLVGAGLLTTSYSKLVRVDRGFDATSVVVATVAPSESRYTTPADVSALYAQLLDRVRAMPEVETATTTYSPPMFDNAFYTRILREGESRETDEPLWVGTVIIGPDYFETNGIPLVAGRGFGPEDRMGAPLAVIVNRTMADRLWPGEDPIGKRIEFAGGIRGSADSFDRAFFPPEPMTVVGVAEDVRRGGLAREIEPEYYRPHEQITWGFQYLMVRARSAPEEVAARIREAVWSVDATIPVREVRTLEDRIAESVAPERFRTLLLLLFAGATCVLALVGLYAVMTLSVTRRVREFGIRIALGARGRDVTAGVMRRGLSVIGVGLLVGLGAAASGSMAAEAVLSDMLFGVGVTDPVVYLAVAAAAALVGALAAWVPARRAGRLDPVSALRQE